MQNNNTPYTYLIGWSKLDKWYYGRRTARNCNPQELWRTYFTSSKIVKKFREDFGEPDVIQVRKIFKAIDTHICKKWESRVLKYFKVSHNVRWLNQKEGDDKWDTTGIPAIVTEKSIAKMKQTKFNKSISKAGFTSLQDLIEFISPLIDAKTDLTNITRASGVSRQIVRELFPIVETDIYKEESKYKMSQSHKDAIVKNNSNKVKSAETRDKISKAITGIVRTEETLLKMSKSRFNLLESGWKYSHSEQTKVSMRKPKRTHPKYFSVPPSNQSGS